MGPRSTWAILCSVELERPVPPSTLPSSACVGARVERVGRGCWVDSLDWRSIGPANMGGRMTDIAVHPLDSSTYWVASASGGILKTTNRGTTYTHEFQDQAVSSIGALAVSPAAPERLWVGTGDGGVSHHAECGWRHHTLAQVGIQGIASLAQTDDGVIWASLDRNGNGRRGGGCVGTSSVRSLTR